VRRIRTNTPVSAFVTLNDPVFVECAQALARRLLDAPVTTDSARVDFAFELVVSRTPQPRERAELLGLLERERDRYRSNPELARAMSGASGETPETELFDRAAWTVVANVVLNLDEALTRN